MASEPEKIQKLDEAVINRIAAGEVIQRPANALKEMIENSLDAKSTNIQITVTNGGLKYIQIVDNGSGIRQEDFPIVCERFTTSKLRQFEDLNLISTYGFRGEALASISHVAHLTIQSKTSKQQCAHTASYVDGKMKDKPKPIAGNQGTQIIVEDLFYNVPIRRKALRSPGEEYQKVSEVVGRYAVHNAKVGFGLRKFGESNDIRTPTDSNHVDNIRTLYGNSIARELIEFSTVNERYKYEARGYITNVNYSSKKFVFLLFINHRLVESQSLKKCIDQVYTMYLPKNMHPFVYLSLTLDPKCVDVNVHPTKHEVSFLHEDRIVEQITHALEQKLLGSNNSRMFYTQNKLPNMSIPVQNKVTSTTAAGRSDKQLVRTDSGEQKLEKFFGAPTKRQTEPANESLNEEEFQKFNSELLQRNASFESRIADKSIRNVVEVEGKKNAEDEQEGSIVIQSTGSEDLTSILKLRRDIEHNTHKTLRDLFAQHVFVGVMDECRALVQHGTRLYLCETATIMREVFYQHLIYNFGKFGHVRFSDPMSIYELALLGLDLPETGWTPDDEPKPRLAHKVTEILTEKGEMLGEYFNVEIDENGYLKALPLLLINHTPELCGLPLYLLRLATELDWDNEKECFEGFCRETATYYAQLHRESCENWEWVVEHVFYPSIKESFLPPRCFTENAAVLELADLPNLYKVFERC